MSRHLTHHFSGATAVVLHHSDDVRDRLTARLKVLGVHAVGRWEKLEEADREADFLILDTDLAHDDQFPWQRAQAPMPVVALIGSESPGRLAWALENRVDAFLPLAALGNIYSALVIARATFDAKVEQRDRDAETARRSSRRLDVIRAVLKLMQESGVDEAVALKQLRAFAMVERVSLEDAAALYLSENPAARRGMQ
ncbi:ANTAR domain-containing response regulator [Tranquillimonas alkanivorans]|uniref:Two-component response regulator, AmiR/NasT family, consists of REC and RNA-binding antiterminator (ANTAR) domains n=1 Tax=Tranquillimonas alkanivorans TaxID=441119 RepID=A0A1I5N8E6_9RHOB|nr:hypothetical protein [Tranquillimonas alkanivorans]SFP18195.1 Two-component response regulator, AmiR/NasT family, consists of REC and RNA-binding antiterminator (ANTAR) domains [Tranquillimonas alkanivorans]